MIRSYILLITLFVFGTLKSSVAQADINIHFVHTVNGTPALYDTLVYVNKAGNRYEINQVQYFISELTLHDVKGNKIELSSDNPVHYVDKDIDKTLLWAMADSVLFGRYDSLTFIFGLSSGRNKSFIYKNPPENLMFWPDVLGGGYHYMKINLKYIDNQGELSNFNCHLGIGRKKNNEGSSSDFIHNFFSVSLPLDLLITNGEPRELQLIMDINKWFDAINNMDFNNFHGIMDNQDAMRLFSENGKQVFSIRKVE